MKRATWIVAVLNGLDAMITVALLRTGYVEEVNPLLREAFRVHEFVFLGMKALLVTLGLVFLWRIRHKYPRVAIAGLNVSVALYVVVVAYSIAMFGYGKWLQANYARAKDPTVEVGR